MYTLTLFSRFQYDTTSDNDDSIIAAEIRNKVIFFVYVYHYLELKNNVLFSAHFFATSYDIPYGWKFGGN